MTWEIIDNLNLNNQITMAGTFWWSQAVQREIDINRSPILTAFSNCLQKSMIHRYVCVCGGGGGGDIAFGEKRVFF